MSSLIWAKKRNNLDKNVSTLTSIIQKTGLYSEKLEMNKSMHTDSE